MRQKYIISLFIASSMVLISTGCDNQTLNEEVGSQSIAINQPKFSTTYTNSKYNYQITYNSAWSPQESEGTSIVRFLPTNDSSASNVKFWVTVDANPKSLTPKDYLKTIKGLKEDEDFTGQTYKLGNQTGFRTTIGTVEHVYITKDKYIYSITRFTSKFDTATFDKVLASFQIK